MTTYTELRDNLKNWNQNFSDEYEDALDEVITMSELRAYRDLNINSMDEEVSGTLVAFTNTITIPGDLIQPRHIRIIYPPNVTDEPRSYILNIKTLEFIRTVYPDAFTITTGVPRYYAVDANNTYLIGPAPAVDTPYTLAYKKRLAPLSTENPENWLSTVGYDCLFWACMAETARFTQDDALLKTSEERYAVAVQGITGVDIRANRDDNRVPTIMTDNR